MSKVRVVAQRLALSLTVAATAALGFGAPAAHAQEGPVNTTVTASFTGTINTVIYGCSGTEVWGVAAGEGTPERQRGNYQVCHYPSSGVELPSSGIEPDSEIYNMAVAAIRKAAYAETAAVSLVSYCPYYMPTGPNRSPSVTYKVKDYNVTVTDHFANGQSFVVATTVGVYLGQASVSWSPKCYTL